MVKNAKNIKETLQIMNSDYSKMSDEELIAAYEEAKHMKIVYNTSQQVKKILLNNQGLDTVTYQ